MRSYKIAWGYNSAYNRAKKRKRRIVKQKIEHRNDYRQVIRLCEYGILNLFELPNVIVFDF